MIIPLGFLAVLRMEISVTTIAALLTIVGYSLNDTIIVFDRIREILRKYKKMPVLEMLNVALNSTLSRTILTSVTTLIALIALYVFGGEVIRGFTGGLIWGIVVGTFSTIGLAAPFLYYFGVRRPGAAGQEEAGKQPAPQSAGSSRGS